MNWVSTGSENGLSPVRRQDIYLNQHLAVANCTLRKKFQWNFNQNTKLFIHENASGNIVCLIAAILFRGRWIKLFSNGCPFPLSVKFIDVVTSCDEHVPQCCTQILIGRYLIAAMLPNLPISACQLSVNLNTNFHLYLQAIILGCVMQNGLWHSWQPLLLIRRHYLVSFKYGSPSSIKHHFTFATFSMGVYEVQAQRFNYHQCFWSYIISRYNLWCPLVIIQVNNLPICHQA